MNDASSPVVDESLWSRLRRRKLVQWTVAYVAGAWGLLQGVAYMRDTFGWPAYVQQAATVLLLIGLPIVLVLAWYHGDRGQRQVTRSELAILTLLFLLGGGLFWYFQRSSEETASETTAHAERTPPSFATDASIAVLPFVNMSSDKEQEYFADGLSEELLNLLAQVPELRVIARTSSFSFKGRNLEIAEIASRLNVAHVLEGSVRKSGDKLRITAQLIRTSDSSHLWSQTFDRQMTDVFQIQDEIAAAVVQQLKIRLLGAAPQAITADATAYALHLQAEAVARQFTKGALEQSLVLYEKALAIDPRYPAALVGMANVYIAQVGEGYRPAHEGVRLAHTLAEKALEIDHDYADAHATLGVIAQLYDRNLAAASRHIERGLALEPANPDLLDAAAFQARRLGRLQQAIAIQEHLVNRDPVNEFAYNELGKTYSYSGRLDEAISAFRTALRLNPSLTDMHMPIAEVFLRKGDATGALIEGRKISHEAWRLYVLSMAYHALGRRKESDDALATFIRNHGSSQPFTIACALSFRGEADRAFEWLATAAQYGDLNLGSLPVYPMFANIRSDPRWLPFLRKHGMAPEQLGVIEFDVKVPK